MACTNPDIGKLISRYEFDLLNDAEKRQFELHLKECKDCFEELYSMTPAVKAMRDNPELYLARLKVRESFYVRLKTLWDNAVEALGGAFRIQPQLIRVAVPAVATAAVAVLAVTIFLGRPGEYARLAVIEKDFYRPIELRTGIDYDKYEICFHEGMVAYAEGDYSQAIKALSESVQLNPKYAKGRFYLGLCYLYEEKIDEAVQQLNQTIAIAEEESLLEKAHWYLGNAYLKKEDGGKALEEFRKVREFQGRYQTDVVTMIERIERVDQ